MVVCAIWPKLVCDKRSWPTLKTIFEKHTTLEHVWYEFAPVEVVATSILRYLWVNIPHLKYHYAAREDYTVIQVTDDT